MPRSAFAALVLILALSPAAPLPARSGAPRATVAAAVPRATGLYVLNEPGNLKPAAINYPSGLFSDSTYLERVAGHAIFVPIAKIVKPISVWGQFTFDWTYLDTLVTDATSHGKSFSIELETGLQTSASTWSQALPANFTATCGAGCAPEFNVWVVGGTSDKCTSAYVPLPWVPNVQVFWARMADSLAAHLRQTGAYSSLTLVHVPGLSVYDEELRLPSGMPSPTTADTLPKCPDGRPPYPTVMTDAAQARWDSLGYSDAAVISGFTAVAQSFANAFPDRMLALSVFPHGGGLGVEFPNFTGDSAGYVITQIVQDVGPFTRGRLQIQSDNLDSAAFANDVISLARQNAAAIGWQTNKHAAAGAGCGGGGALSCLPDALNGHYEQLLAFGAAQDAHYIEVWPADVMTYPQSVEGALAAGDYGTASAAPPATPAALELRQNAPNPWSSRTTITYALARPGSVSLAVYDLAGRRVAVLAHGEQAAGEHRVPVERSGLGSGVYFYRLEVNGAVETKWFVLLY